MSTSPTLGRRELNKARTREALVEALRALARRHPLPHITVDQIAEEADVSRRTFFNYFGSIPALLSEVFAGYAVAMVEALDREAVAADPVGAFRALVQAEGISDDFVGWLAVLNCHDVDNEPSVLIERAVWANLAGWLEGVLVDLLPDGTDPLYVSTLAAGVMSTFRAAEQTWLAGLDTCHGITPEQVQDFTTHLDRALSYLEVGWRRAT